MFGTIRKHQQWLWIFIIAIIIVSFVVFFSPDADLGLGGQRNDLLINGKPVTINGEPLSTKEFIHAFRETRLSYFFRSGGKEWPENDRNTAERLENDAIFRAFLVRKAKELDISVSDVAVAQLYRDRVGQYPLPNFVKDFLTPNEVSQEDFERFLRNEAAIQQLVGVAALSAKMFSPAEAEILYRKENQQFAVQVAMFSASNYLDKVEAKPEEISKFFTNRMAMYRIPERIQVSYLEFAATNFLADADKLIAQQTNINAYIDEQFARRGTNDLLDAEGKPLPEAEAKKKIREEIREAMALNEAHRKAAEFGSDLFKGQVTTTDAFEKMAAAKGYEVKVTEPFDRSTGLTTNFPAEFRQKAFSLAEPQAVSVHPIKGDDAVYLIALKKRIPSEQQNYEQVKDKVATDYKMSQATDLARKAGNSFATMVTNGLAQKKTFEQIANEANVKPIDIPPFSPSDTTVTNLPGQLNLRMLQSTVNDMQSGEATGYLPMGPQGGYVLHLKAKLPIDETKMKQSMPEFAGRLRAYRQSEAFNQWFRKQAELARLSIPQREAPKAPGPTASR